MIEQLRQQGQFCNDRSINSSDDQQAKMCIRDSGREGAKKMMDQYQHSLENMNNAAVEYLSLIHI